MSKLTNRINQLQQLKEDLVDKVDTQAITRQSYITLLKLHILSLKELNTLADSFENNDTDMIADWVKRRCNGEVPPRLTPENENEERLRSIIDASEPMDYLIKIKGIPPLTPTRVVVEGNKVVLEVV